MPRGYSDFGLNPGNYGQFSGDNAELAARLGSQVVFERRGRVLWFDDMTQALAKYLVFLDDAAQADLVIDAGFKNGAAIRLIPDAATDQTPELLVTLPIITATKVGIEFLIRWVSNNDANATSFDLLFYYQDGTIQHGFHYYFIPLNQTIEIDSALPGIPGSPAVISTHYDFWGTGSEVGTNYFKTVFNLADFSFDRIIFNQLGANLKMYSSLPTPVISRPRLDMLIYCNPNAAVNPVYLSDLIITLDEP